MYGSLDAAQRWGEHYAQVLEKGGCTRGVASPCHFFHKDLETYILVHGDDFFIVGRQEGREHVLRLLRSAYELSKVVTLGPGPSQSRTATILGRTLTLRQWGIEYEPDQQHVSRALKALGLTGAKGVGTPGTDDVGGPKASEISDQKPVKSARCAKQQNGSGLRGNRRQSTHHCFEGFSRSHPTQNKMFAYAAQACLNVSRLRASCP